MVLKHYEMGLLSKYWTPEQGKEYIIEIVGNEYTKENFKKDGKEEIKDVMIYKISAVQEIGTNNVTTFDTPKEWKTASPKVHLSIQMIIKEAIDEGKDVIRVQVRRDNDNRYNVFKWVMPRF
jgi:hypothetical protein